MKIIKTTQSLIIDDVFKLEAGHRYVCSDFIVKQIIRTHAISISNVEEFEPHYKPYDGSDLTNKNILIWRSGGIGDLLFITPNLKHIKDMWPTARIRIACSSKYLDLWRDHQLLYDGHAFPMPFDAELLDWADYHLHFEGVIETGGRAETVNAIDLFSEYFHFDGKIPVEKRRPVVPSCDELNNKMKNVLTYSMGVDLSKPIVLIQFRASAPIRTFPERRTIEIAIRLEEPGRNIIIVDHPGMSPRIKEFLNAYDNPPNIYNGAAYIKNIRDTIAMLKKSALLIAPDSSLTHIAGAINVDIPTLAIYGPFPSKVRTTYYPKCVNIDANYRPNGNSKCGGNPCFKHGHEPCLEAKARGTTESPCFATIKNKTIIYIAERMLEAINARQ